MNPFEALADAQIANPVKSRLKAAETRRDKRARAEKELAEDEILTRQWRRWRREKLDALLAGRHGADIKGLIRFMDTMTLSSAPALLTLIERAAWIRNLSEDERHDLLTVIGSRITRLRIKAGLPPFDDGLPGDPPKAFEQIKDAFGVR